MLGRTLARYRIIEKLGQGGMGVVYRAEDVDLRRSVALKVLPPEVAADADRLRRFVQEARAASALSHPNIAHIYEIGDADGVRFIAMEYVDGEPLSERIAGRPLPAEEMISIVEQVAAALGEAHARGIVHRVLDGGGMGL